MLGYYTIANGFLLRLTSMLNQTVSPVSLPTFSRLQHSPDQMRRAFLTATRMTSLVAFPAFLGMSALAPELIEVLLGARWAPSIPVMRILAVIGILRSVFFLNGAVMLALGKPSWMLAQRLLETVVILAAFFPAVRWGIVGVAAAFVITRYLLSPLPLWLMHKLIRLHPATYLRQFVVPLGGSFVMVLGVLMVKHFLADLLNLHALLALCIVVGVVIYSAMILLFGRALARETRDLVRLAWPFRTSKKQ